MKNPLTAILASLDKPATATRSSADLRADLGRVDLAALQAKVADVEAVRRRLLLSGTDDELRENARELDDAKLAEERGAALIDELGKLAAAAEQRERAAQEQAEYEAAQREAAKLAETYGAIDALTEKLAELLREASRSYAAVHRWNSKIRMATEDRRVTAVPVEAVKRKILGAIQ